MESNYDGGIFVGWGMSRASKRAKERQNRSSDELVMDKTKISRSLKLQVTDVRKRRMSGASDVRESRKSVNFILLAGFGRPVDDGRPVLRGGSGRPEKRRSSGGSGSTRDASSGTRFWAKNGDFGVKIHGISWMNDGETWGNARST